MRSSKWFRAPEHFNRNGSYFAEQRIYPSIILRTDSWKEKIQRDSVRISRSHNQSCIKSADSLHCFYSFPTNFSFWFARLGYRQFVSVIWKRFIRVFQKSRFVPTIWASRNGNASTKPVWFWLPLIWRQIYSSELKWKRFSIRHNIEYIYIFQSLVGRFRFVHHWRGVHSFRANGTAAAEIQIQSTGDGWRQKLPIRVHMQSDLSWNGFQSIALQAHRRFVCSNQRIVLSDALQTIPNGSRHLLVGEPAILRKPNGGNDG